MKVKAMVAKIDQEKKIMVVFTKDRQFIRLPLPEHIPCLGSTIQVNLPSARRPMISFLNRKWLAAAAVLLLVFTMGLFSTFGVAPVSAYVTLDMKPSLRLSVDDKGKIKSVTALNEDGRRLADKLDVDNMDVYLAVRDIVREADSLGYLDAQKENLVMAGIISIEDSDYQIDRSKLRLIIHDQLSAKHYPGYVVVYDTDRNQWESAQKWGYGVNQLTISERAREKGIDIKPEDLNQRDLIQVMKDNKVSVPMLFPGDSCKVNWQGAAGSSYQQNVGQPSTGSGYNKWYSDAQWQSSNQEGSNWKKPGENNTQSYGTKSNNNNDCESPNQYGGVKPAPSGQKAGGSVPSPAYPPAWNGQNWMSDERDERYSGHTSERSW